MDLRIPSVRQALPRDMTVEEVQKGGGGCHARFTELKSKFYGSRELYQNFHELHKIQHLILFVVHIVLKNWGINYYFFHALQYHIYNNSQLHALLSVYSVHKQNWSHFIICNPLV